MFQKQFANLTYSSRRMARIGGDTLHEPLVLMKPGMALAFPECDSAITPDILTTSHYIFPPTFSNNPFFMSS